MSEDGDGGRARMSVDPILLAAVVAAAGVMTFVLRRGPSRARRHLVLVSAGLLMLAGVWLTPLTAIAQHDLLSMHLLQITIVMGVVPPVLLLAIPRDAHITVRRPVLVALRTLTHPIVAILLVNGAFFGWHLSGPYTTAMDRDWLYALQQLTLLLVSIAFWWPIITPLAPPARSMAPVAKMGYILLATIPQTLGGLIVALSHHVLYPMYAAAPRLLGLDVMTDQQIAGASIALVSKIALFTAFIVIFMRALDSGVRETDDGGGGDGGIGPVNVPGPLPSGTPQWLSDLARDRTVPEPRPRRVRVPAGSGPRRS